ncbi:MAG: xanthine dehydrogenase family protein molybdopterin-binding subunit [Firmicutes bacterium]|nr:xanthine dehydrogenase family protein molybdopterin-binding subunit [Bacillota bacterium]
MNPEKGTRTTIIGQDVVRPDALAKATGRAVFAGDVRRPGMLRARCLRSPYPHARILRIDTGKALALPGVKAVLTGEDLDPRLVGFKLKDQPLLARDVIRHAGERVAVVAAEDPSILENALRLIEVEYEELRAVFDPVEAMSPGAPLVHESLAGYKGLPETGGIPNVCALTRAGKGEVERGMAEADAVFEDVFELQAVHQGYMEPHSSLVEVGPDGTVRVWSSHKAPFVLRSHLAGNLGIPPEKIVVHNPYVGGDFGGKGFLMDEPLCYYLSLATGRPVRMDMSRDEEFIAGTKRHPGQVRIKTGVMRDGTIVARDVAIVFNSGAYASAKPNVTVVGYKSACGVYRIPHTRVEARCVYTHTSPGGHVRAPGDPQVFFAVEHHMDKIAARIGLDPVEFRRRNLLREGDEGPVKEHWTGIVAEQTMDAAVKAAPAMISALAAPAVSAASLAGPGPRPGSSQPGSPESATGTHRSRGAGIACSQRKVGGGESEAMVTLDRTGRALLYTGASESGPGCHGVLRQIVAAELGLAADEVDVVVVGAGQEPALYDKGTGASRVTHVSGEAARRAAAQARERLLERAGGTAGSSGSIVSVAEAVLAEGETVDGRCRYEAGETPYTCFTSQVAEVEVDLETGQVKLTALTSTNDVGVVLNPSAAEGQITGGASMGAGYALFEEIVETDGLTRNPSFLDYRMPTAADLPSFKTLFVEGAPGPGPFGAKGIGELGVSPTAPAIANAVAKATGCWFDSLPITPEKVWRALRKR